MRGLLGSKIIITGASGGIGFAIAKAFAAQGSSKLYLVGRTQQTLDDAKNRVNSEHKDAEIITIRGDVANYAFWDEISNAANDVDVLVNAAGITHASPLLATSRSMIQEVYETNLLGTTFACRSIAKRFLKQRSLKQRSEENAGCIINVSSLLGLKGGRGSVAYAASKAGVIALTRSLALELAPFVRVNVIVPGYVDTRMTEAMDEKARVLATESIPQGRFGRPEEIAHAAIFLATNSYAQNTIVNIDGGL